MPGRLLAIFLRFAYIEVLNKIVHLNLVSDHLDSKLRPVLRWPLRIWNNCRASTLISLYLAAIDNKFSARTGLTNLLVVVVLHMDVILPYQRLSCGFNWPFGVQTNYGWVHLILAAFIWHLILLLVHYLLLLSPHLAKVGGVSYQIQLSLILLNICLVIILTGNQHSAKLVLTDGRGVCRCRSCMCHYTLCIWVKSVANNNFVLLLGARHNSSSSRGELQGALANSPTLLGGLL